MKGQKININTTTTTTTINNIMIIIVYSIIFNLRFKLFNMNCRIISILVGIL
ncbi:hypothetical protein H8356DRAFT_1325850 [Neocallimastix lanati (nom. inval.)]|nr:hypothetical protein H8356DRAFT_1325850 [Neocallimastix sp. JGI-2020a]